MMYRGYVRVWRKTMDSRVFKSEGLLKVWVWCLMRAAHKERWVKLKTGRGVIEVRVLPGQFVFGRKSASEELDMKPSTVWKRIQKLKNLSNLNIESNRQYSLISIINWHIYQPPIKEGDSESDRQGTGKEQARNTNNNVKNVKKKEKEYTSFENEGQKDEEVYLTKKGKKLSGKRLKTFLQFWDTFDHKSGKADAADIWLGIPTLTDSIMVDILSAAKIEAGNRPAWRAKGNTPKMAQGWLSGRRWEDEVIEKQTKGDYDDKYETIDYESIPGRDEKA